jgi:Xaa-Pro aminopeptidase/Xaa-Pro dipeptidase
MNKLTAAIKSAQITDSVFHALIKEIYPGQSEKTLKMRIRMWAAHFGAKRLAFPPIVASGVHGAKPHGTTKNRLIGKNDLVVIDLGVVYNGICSDLTRTVILGKPSAKQLKVYKAVVKAQSLALKKVKAGKRCSEIDSAARDYLKKAGFGHFFIHTTGHGVGRKIHEAPKISLKNKRRLEAGQIITVEPGVYIKGWGGVRIEDLVLVTKTGYRLLSHANRNLRIKK